MDVERTMAFLLEGQARFDGQMAELTDKLKIISDRVDRIAAALETVVHVQAGHQDVIDALFPVQRQNDERLAEQSRRTDERLNSLIEQAKHTDARLDALIQVVDGSFAARRVSSLVLSVSPAVPNRAV